MLIAESSMVHALLLLGRSALPVRPLHFVLSSSHDVPYPFQAFGRRYPVLIGQMPSYLVAMRQGFHSHIMVILDLLCDLSLVG
jgi:hypothetical protein